MWYGSEVISHHDTIFHGEVDFNSCVTIHLTDVTHEVRFWAKKKKQEKD